MIDGTKKDLTRSILTIVLNRKILLLILILLNVFFTPFASLFSDGGGQITRIYPIDKGPIYSYPALEIYSYNNRIEANSQITYLSFTYWTARGSGGWDGNKILSASITWDKENEIPLSFKDDCSGLSDCYQGQYHWLFVLDSPKGYGQHQLFLKIIDDAGSTSIFNLSYYYYSIYQDPVLLLLIVFELILVVVFGVGELTKFDLFVKNRSKLKNFIVTVLILVVMQGIFSVVYTISTSVKNLILLIPIIIVILVFLFDKQVNNIVSSLRQSSKPKQFSVSSRFKFNQMMVIKGMIKSKDEIEVKELVHLLNCSEEEILSLLYEFIAFSKSKIHIENGLVVIVRESQSENEQFVREVDQFFSDTRTTGTSPITIFVLILLGIRTLGQTFLFLISLNFLYLVIGMLFLSAFVFILKRNSIGHVLSFFVNSLDIVGVLIIFSTPYYYYTTSPAELLFSFIWDCFIFILTYLDFRIVYKTRNSFISS